MNVALLTLFLLPSLPAETLPAPDAAPVNMAPEPSPAADTQGEGRVVEVGQARIPINLVEVSHGDRDPERLTNGMKILTGDKIRTGRQSSVEITFDNDGEIKLEGSTLIEILSADTPSLCHGGPKIVAIVSLREGRMQVYHEENRQERPDVVAVTTSSAEICLKGTQVGVWADKNGVTGVKVLNGKVEVTTLGRDKRGQKKSWGPILVREGSQVLAEYNRPPTLPQPFSGWRLMLSLASEVFSWLPDTPVLDGLDPGGFPRLNH